MDPANTPEVWYRFRDMQFWPAGAEDSSDPSCYRLQARLDRFYVVGTTRCGIWLSSQRPMVSWAKKRLLYPSSRRPWAWPTIPLAWRSFQARKD